MSKFKFQMNPEGPKILDIESFGIDLTFEF